MAYNESLIYQIIELNDENEFKNRKIVVAKELLKNVINDCDIKNYKIINEIKGESFRGTICTHPFSNLGFNYDVPMLEARFVTIEQGTGIVHCAPSHGPDDFNLCLKNNISSSYTVDNAGLYTKEVPYFNGSHSRRIIIAMIK